MKQEDKDFLLIHRCQNDEQRIKLLEFFRMMDAGNISYDRYDVPVSELGIPSETLAELNIPGLEDMIISFDIWIPTRKQIFNLYVSSNYCGLKNKTDALANQAIAQLIGNDADPKAHETLVAALRRHLITHAITFPMALEIQLSSPWYCGKNIDMWILRALNFDKLRASLFG